MSDIRIDVIQRQMNKSPLPTIPSKGIIILSNGYKGISLSGKFIHHFWSLFRSQIRDSGGNDVVGHQVLPEGHDVMYCERNV